MTRALPVQIVSDGDDIFVVRDGVRIARRGHPGTPQAKTWVALEPGYVVLDADGGRELIVKYNDTRIQ
jgi:hypothetical protein